MAHLEHAEATAADAAQASRGGRSRPRVCEAALRLLETSDPTVAGVATAVGFRDLSHFNRTFGQLVGVGPGRYRADRRWRQVTGNP